MENVLGIIAEYNPFHNGHLYHLEKTKKITNCKYAIAVISGNFTQNGSPSLIDKWKKTEMAILNGIDLVIELPVLYAISSAENFADGAIKILNSLNIVDYISFGSETNDLETLKKIANILLDEPKDFKTYLSNELDKGISFPTARNNALNSFFKMNLENIISSPNNILGLEYLKALKKQNSIIKPVCVKRTDNGYNNLDILDSAKKSNQEKFFVSASTIRNDIKNSKSLENVLPYLPASSISVLSDCYNNHNMIQDLNVFSREIIYTLRKMSIEDISNLPDVSEGLEYSIKSASNICNNLDMLIEKIKTKRYTYSRIKRILLYALLGINKKDMELSKAISYPYVRVLGLNDNGKLLLSNICKQNPNLYVISSVKKFVDSTNVNNDIKKILKYDIMSSDIYSLGLNNNYFANLDYTNNLFYHPNI